MRSFRNTLKVVLSSIAFLTTACTDLTTIDCLPWGPEGPELLNELCGDREIDCLELLYCDPTPSNSEKSGSTEDEHDDGGSTPPGATEDGPQTDKS